MTKILYLILGGALGTIMRYLVCLFYENKFSSTFPLGSFTVNLVGSFLIGLAYALLQKSGIPTNLRMFLFIGFFGSFTTFSTFSMDSLVLFQEGHIKTALTYIISSNLFGILLCFLGLLLGNWCVEKI